MTEDQAREKWCFRTERAFNANRDSTGRFAKHTCCMASVCMAWRWGFSPEHSPDAEPGDHHGYCGLAGKL